MDEFGKKITSIGKLNEASKNIASLSKAFDEVYDKGYVSLDTISSIKEAVGDSVDNWSDYEHILMTAKEGSSELNQALSDLTYKMLESTFTTEGLANATEEQITAVLRESGVLNANEVAQSAKAQAIADTTLATYDGTDASYENAEAMLEEKLKAEECQIALARLKIAKILFNENTEEDVQEIINLTEQAKMSVVAMNDFARAKAELAKDFMGPLSPTTQAILNGTYKVEYDGIADTSVDYPSKTLEDRQKKAAAEKEKEYAEKVADIREDLAEKEAQFAEDMAEAWKKEHLEQLKDGLKQQEDIINRYKKNLEITDFGLDTVETNDFQSRSDLFRIFCIWAG